RHDVAGVRGDEGEGGYRAAARAEELDGPRAELLDEGVEVLGLLLGAVRRLAVVSRAAPEPAGVVRHDGALGEVRGERAETFSGHGLADEEQHGTLVRRRDRPAHVEGDRGAGDRE